MDGSVYVHISKRTIRFPSTRNMSL